MAKKIIGPNSINVRLFSAIKICEKAGLPLLILSNPGFSKSSTVFMYCEITGRTLIQLRSNSTTHEEVVGYDTVENLPSLKRGEPRAAIHLRPAWFQRLLDADARGEKCLLFLDEITTSDSRVQSALLHLIFERRCGDEKLPDSTLIISAGNYMSNLARDLSGLMAPTMNRFIIYNLRFEMSDLDAFLGHYSGAMVGHRVDYMKELRKALEDIDKQETKIPEDRKIKILELLENGIKEQTKALMTRGEKVLDMNESELDGIYEDINETNGKVLGFITPRGLYYSVKLAYSAYQCFGKAGLQSDVFKSLLEGIIGLALSREKKTGDVKKTLVVQEYFNILQAIANDIEKMKNDRLPEYEKFFVDMINDGDKTRETFGVPEINAIINKISELRADPEMKTIERPIQPGFISKLCEISSRTGSEFKKTFKLSVTGSGSSTTSAIKAEDLAGLVVKWNALASLLSTLITTVSDSGLKYSADDISLAETTGRDLRQVGFKLRGLRKIVISENPGVANIVPEIHSIKALEES